MNQLEQLCENVLMELAKEGYTPLGISKHRNSYKAFCQFASSICSEHYSDEILDQFLEAKYASKMTGKCGSHTYWVRQKITHLKKLKHFYTHQTIHYHKRDGQKQQQVCPTCYLEIYNQFLLDFQSSGYAESTVRRMRFQTLKLLQYLEQSRIDEIQMLTWDIISAYLLSHQMQSKQYLKGIAACLKRFLRYLYEENIIEKDLSSYIPCIHLSREAFLPSTIDNDEIQVILRSIDTTSTIGKRDLALLLLASKMGLRSCDIKNLQLRDFNWKTCTLSLIQQKTRKHLRVPIPTEVGWAIIDYLQNGRPESDDSHLFIRHSTSGGAFSKDNKLQEALHKYMRRAHIENPLFEHRGLHSLRSGYAKKLLEKEIPIPVISELLGHSSTLATSRYLKIDTNSLLQCAIDVDEVVNHE